LDTITTDEESAPIESFVRIQWLEQSPHLDFILEERISNLKSKWESKEKNE
jgi:hypothetical protein